MKPTPGSIVNYVLDGGPNMGEIRPAIIVKVWSDDLIQLQVFTDNTNDRLYDGLAVGVVWRTSVKYDESHEPEPRTWHWPARA